MLHVVHESYGLSFNSSTLRVLGRGARRARMTNFLWRTSAIRRRLTFQKGIVPASETDLSPPLNALRI